MPPVRSNVRGAYRKAIIVEAMGGECRECGETRLAALSLHHRFPETRTTPTSQYRRGGSGSLWSRAITTKTWAEVWLCDLLCHNCHRCHHAYYDDAQAGDVLNGSQT